jgi:hypothetical protein
MQNIRTRLDEFRRIIEQTKKNRIAEGLFQTYGEVLRFYRTLNRTRLDPEVSAKGDDYEELHELAHEAIITLGGQTEHTLSTLADYDANQFGPMLGVSNEGGATAAIRHGALASPKCHAFPDRIRDPYFVGVAHDAERLGAVGEVAVGPDEYAEISLACIDRMLTTTNVGTRANVRLYRSPEVVTITSKKTGKMVASAVEELAAYFEPYWKTPSGRPRSSIVLIQFERKLSAAKSAAIFGKLADAVAAGTFCSPKLHRLGLLVRVGPKITRIKHTQAAIALAKKCGLDEVFLDGPSIRAAAEPLAGLLNQFEETELATLLPLAAKNGLRLKPKVQVDPATTARHVWTGLSVARNMGFSLGKYGLVPLTLDEQKEVIARIQYWFASWCAAPVCYIDYPILTDNQIYNGSSLAQGIELWLKMVKTQNVRVVLIDTSKKSEGRHLLKTTTDDFKGFFSLPEVQMLDAIGKTHGIKVLWAGGITLPQAYQMGRLGVFGIYVTSAAATLKPIGDRYRRDPFLTGVREPDPEAVARVGLLMQTGFLVARLKSKAKDLETACERFLAVLNGKDPAKARDQEATLHALAVKTWQDLLRDKV